MLPSGDVSSGSRFMAGACDVVRLYVNRVLSGPMPVVAPPGVELVLSVELQHAQTVIYSSTHKNTAVSKAFSKSNFTIFKRTAYMD